MILYVDINGNDETATGTSEQPFKSPRAAFARARSGDEIHIANGSYGEPSLGQRVRQASERIVRLLRRLR